jgi:subtilisin family serine protease
VRLVCGALVLAALLPSAGAARDTPSSAFWVFFRDRPVASGAAVTVTPRALARRAKAARARGEAAPGDGARAPVDDRDRDPDAGYVRAVESAGGTLRVRSRWLNAVSVDADSAALVRIQALPFVTGVDRVAVLTLPEAAMSTESVGTSAPARTNTAAADQADAVEYGDSYRQLEMLGVPEAHAMGYHGEGVLICVLDSGFERSHEVFDRLRIREERDFVFDDRDTGYDPSQDLLTQADHGTAVLSVLAGYAPGRLIGPAYESEFILGKTERTGSELRSEEDHWCEAVEWAEAEGADIVSSSLSYPLWYRLPERDGRTAENSRVATIALERGLLVVNSTGNYGPGPLTLSPPSDAPGVLAVGSVDANGTLSRFSSIGPTWDRRIKPDLVAMGTATRQAKGRTRHDYTTANGTSFSTPLVAGCAAIVLGAHPDWSPEAVWEALAMSADRASRPDPSYGWGIPNVRDAIVYPQIEGRITDVSTPGNPTVGKPATISWEPAGSATTDTLAAAPSDSPRTGSVQADSSGAYVIPNLPTGTYRLTIEAPGYFRAQSEPLQVPPGLGDVDFALRYRGE